MMKVGRRSTKAQFVQRSAAVAKELGTRLSESQAAELYDDRSALVHGGGIDLSKPHKRTAFEDAFVALQETACGTVRHAMEDPAFAAIFDEESSITARW
jgi:hypothetical protein